MPEAQHLDDLFMFAHAIDDAVRMVNNLAQIRLAAFRHDATEQRMFAEQLQFFEQGQSEAFGGGGVVAGDVANRTKPARSSLAISVTRTWKAMTGDFSPPVRAE